LTEHRRGAKARKKEEERMKKLSLLVVGLVLSMAFAVPVMACCYMNKDVHNNTGQPAWDFKIILIGTQTVLEHYDGYPTDYRFTQFDVDSLSMPGFTILRWTLPVDPSGVPGPIPYCSWVHIGYHTLYPAHVYLACWTDLAGNCILRFGRHPVRQPSHDFVWGSFTNRQVVLRIFNYLEESTDSIKIRNIYYAILSSEVPLEDLNPANMTLAAQLQPLNAGPFVIGPTPSHGGFVTLNIPEPVQPGQHVVVRFEGVDSTFALPDNAFIDFGQHQMEDLAPVPSLSQWAIIALIASLVAVGAVLIVRRRRTAMA